MSLLANTGSIIMSSISFQMFLRLLVSEDENKEKSSLHQTAATELILSTVTVGGVFGRRIRLPTFRTEDFVGSRGRHYELEEVLDW